MRVRGSTHRRQSSIGGSPKNCEIVENRYSVQLPENISTFLISFVAKARNYPEVRRIFLYGSYAQGNWNDESDIDIAVFIRNGEKEKTREVYKRLSALCYDYPFDVQIQVFFESELQNPMGIIEEITGYGIEISNL